MQEVVLRFKEDLAQVKQLVQESKFVEAVTLCDQVISKTTFDETSSDTAIVGRLKLTQQINERFAVIRNVRLVSCLQHSLSTLFRKQTSFDSLQKLYEQTAAGYLALFNGRTEQLCLDLKMRLRDATRSRVNLVLLKYATETNCKWLTRIGVTPGNYLKQTGLSQDLLTSATAFAFDSSDSAKIGSGHNPAINLSTE